MVLLVKEVLDLQAVYSKIKDFAFPAMTSYQLAKLFKAVDDVANDYRSNLDKLILENCQKDEEGNPVKGISKLSDGSEREGIQIEPEKIEYVQQEVNNLLETLTELPDIRISLDDIKYENIPTDFLLPLLPFIEE